MLLLSACTDPTTDDGADDTGTSADDTAETEDTGEPVVDHDPNVDHWLPQGYAPKALSRVIFLGDSITDGSGASRNALTYVSLLQDNAGWKGYDELTLPARFGEVEVVDHARGGATTNSLRYQQLKQVAETVGDVAEGPTAVMVTVAGNDVQGLIMNTDETEATIADALDNLNAVVDFFQDPTRFPDGVWLYLANVYEPSDGVGQADECFFGLELTDVLDALHQLNAATRALAEERGFAWLDMHGHFLGHGYYADNDTNPYYQADDPTLWFASDCIHPNDRGHHEIRRLFWYTAAGEDWPGDEVPAE